MVAVNTISRVGQYITRPKRPIMGVLGENIKTTAINYPGSVLLSVGLSSANPVLAGIGGVMSLVTSVYTLGRYFNRMGKGLYMKFENQVGQDALEKFSKVDFSKLKGINLNKLAKGKIRVDSPDAKLFMDGVNAARLNNSNPNFNTLNRVDIFKLSK